MQHNYNELFISVPWGNLALITWGDSASEPVLMVHGRQDSAATFIPLVEHLPKEFYYVAVDLPGHGKSDALPKGVPISRLQLVHAIDLVVRYMEWKKFIYLAHSMGCELGLFYNASNPGVISRFVLLDPGPTFQRLQQPDLQRYLQHYYERYYSNYKRYNGPNRLYTKEDAVSAVMRSRGTSEELAQLLLSRSLVHVDGDQYRLTWDSRSRHMVPPYMTNDFYLELFTMNSPPTLIIAMTEGHGGHMRGIEGANYLIENMLKRIKYVRRVVLEGRHSHHVTKPEDMKGCIEVFLHEKFDEVKSKL